MEVMRNQPSALFLQPYPDLVVGVADGVDDDGVLIQASFSLIVSQAVQAVQGLHCPPLTLPAYIITVQQHTALKNITS